VRLRALDQRGRGAGAECPDARVEAGIHQPGHQRNLRPDDDEVAALLARERDQTGDVVRGDVEAGDLVARDAGVAGGGDDLRQLRAAQEGADERVLAPARTDYEYTFQQQILRATR
jgi:hypothetical protein